jgi:serine/threonine protein kinase
VTGQKVAENVEEISPARLNHIRYLAQGASSIVRLMELDQSSQVVLKSYTQPRLAIETKEEREVVVSIRSSVTPAGLESNTPDSICNEDQILTRDSVFELNTLEKLKHPNIIKLIGKISTPLAAVLEYVPGGTLADAIWKKQIGEEGDDKSALKFRVASQIASALVYIHSENVIHRDLKPSNILVVSLEEDADILVKLADFGCAFWIGESSAVTVGTPFFMAPEAYDNTIESLAPTLDIFSFGMVLWCIWDSSTPWKSIGATELEEIRTGCRRPRLRLRWPSVIQTIISSSWDQSPANRPTANAIYLHLNSVLTPPNPEPSLTEQDASSESVPIV